MDCKICGTILPGSRSLAKHIEWHNSADKRTEGNAYTELCYGCGDFYARGQDFQEHSAVCLEKPFIETGGYARGEDTASYNPAAVTQEGHRSSSSGYIKQLIAATLRSGGPHSENENKTVSHHPHLHRPGQCISDMSQKPSKEDKDMKVITSESDYWKRFEEKVCYNGGRTPTWEHTPPYGNQ